VNNQTPMGLRVAKLLSSFSYLAKILNQRIHTDFLCLATKWL
jgi:hypothetical protein